MTHGHRILLKCARWVHVYLTMFAFLLILFFAATGFVLNHEDWFDFDETTTTVTSAEVPATFLSEPDKLAIVEFLRKNHRIGGSVDPKDFEVETDTLQVIFRGPGRQCTAKIDRQTGSAELTLDSRGLLGMLTDLHRGKSTGVAWGLIIDGVCAALLIISITGLILWTSLRGRAQHGLVFMVMGFALAVGVYFMYVP